MKYCADERCVSDIPNQCGLENLDGFQDHRHDQSIITLLQLKYNLPCVDGTYWYQIFYKMECIRT